MQCSDKGPSFGRKLGRAEQSRHVMGSQCKIKWNGNWKAINWERRAFLNCTVSFTPCQSPVLCVVNSDWAASSCSQTNQWRYSTTMSHVTSWIYDYKTGTHSVTIRPDDKQLSLVCFLLVGEWKVKVSPWCLSVNWAYYVSASGCRGRREGRKRGRREEGKEGRYNRGLSLQRRQMSQSLFSRTMGRPTHSALLFLFTN